MSPERSPNIVSVVIEIDRDQMRRRGKLGAAARNERHDASVLAARAMHTRLAKKSADEQHTYFSDLGKRSHAARRARAASAVEKGGAA